MKRLLLCIVVLSITPVNPVFARRPRAVNVNASGGKITDITGNSITVQVSKTKHTYRITGNTSIHLDGRKANTGDLKKGMRAEVTASQLDANAASAIDASTGN